MCVHRESIVHLRKEGGMRSPRVDYVRIAVTVPVPVVAVILTVTVLVL